MKKRGPKGPNFASREIVLNMAEHLVRTRKITPGEAIRMAIDAVFDFASVVLEDGSTVSPDDARGLIRRSSEFHRKYGPRQEVPENLPRVGNRTYEDLFKSGGNLEDNGFEPSPPDDWPPGSLHSRDTVVEQLSRKLRERLRTNPI